MEKFKVIATQIHDGSYQSYCISRAGDDERARSEKTTSGKVFVDVFDTYGNARAYLEGCLDSFGCEASAKKETAPHPEK